MLGTKGRKKKQLRHVNAEIGGVNFQAPELEKMPENRPFARQVNSR